ncbi:response regulator [Pseudoxanthomonas indica]|uniref:CheY chemotaxis protein or a CheY-like REC (Receiver) domain n=1 Tax=Pseudoxanthomonas indica TaxID=428993 RepID=A0A1T5LAL7_9GAMM|nr:response regulator [Pseudoxanthomonas indica]GGD32803.1 hypothetical protein GCM10007235_00830 [Pseudoxanthomonas indica]SKC73087.1 CheY chemotaxis protein or a CheY-like REC (receiver) domain [Pseudoxanthomonas indica]
METLLAGKRVLVVEDESLVAELVADIADDMSAERVGIVATVGQALKSIATEPWDLAILDFNLQGTPSWPVAEALRDRGIPYLMVSGYGQDLIVDPGTPLLAKPYSVADFVAAIRLVCHATPSSHNVAGATGSGTLAGSGAPPVTPRLR